MRNFALPVLLAPAVLTIAACQPAPESPPQANVSAADISPLERAGIAAGVVADARGTSVIGLYQHMHEAGRDALCIVPGEKGRFVFGAQAVFGEETICRGHGTARMAGDKLILNFARSACLVVAGYDGDRVSLPGALDMTCADLCTNRGTFEGVSFPRVSSEISAARAVRDREGDPLCSQK
jgi:hypothetical protein